MDNFQFSNPFVGLPRLSKAIASVLTGFLVLDLLFPGLARVFALNVGYTFPYVWNVVTSGYYESYLLTGILNIMFLLLSGKFIEPIWGSKEFLRFIIIVNLGAGVGAFFLMLLLYVIFRDSYFLYDSNLCGFSGVMTGYSVALKQLLPEQETRLFFSINVRMKQLPGIIVLSSVALFTFGLFPSHHLPHVLFGVTTGYIYLRFYQRKGDVVGDLSDEFAFATFFPEPIRPFVNIITTILYKITYVPMRFAGIVPQRTRPVQSAESSYNTLLSNTVVSTNTLDVERRRMLAAKALDARIQASRPSAPPAPDSPTISSSPPESPLPSRDPPSPSAPLLDSSSELAQSQ